MPRPRPSPRPLPRLASDSWAGAFAVGSPEYTACIAAGAGTVLAATERMYLLRPGAAGLLARDTPEGMGDVVAVAVEARRPARFAVAGVDSLAIFDGDAVAFVRFPEDHGEPKDLAWGPAGAGDPRTTLYVGFDTGMLLRLVPEGGDFEQLALPGAVDVAVKARALASDEAGGLAFACFDEQDWNLDVWMLTDATEWSWLRRSVVAPSFVSGVEIAVAGMAAAVSFERGGVWITRAKEQEFAEVEALRGGGPIAFEGAAADAALFCAVPDGADAQAIVRVDAAGDAARIGEITAKDNDLSPLLPIRALAWDATRRTLWSAAGRAGVLRSTAPGAPPPMGAAAAS